MREETRARTFILARPTSTDVPPLLHSILVSRYRYVDVSRNSRNLNIISISQTP